MIFINKISSHSAIDYAAEELRKYLYMMMPEGDNITTRYCTDSHDGFRLGLMSDFGLDTSDVEDTELDDIIYIDCDERGGIIAGSNPRSVLIAVYDYLKKNGCRFIMPGKDGEYIPIKNIQSVKYRHKPSMRYRGWCLEGGVSQEIMIESIDYTAKLGMNTVMLEFLVPVSYYRRYYRHVYNEKNRPPEDVSTEQILQWKRECEAEIVKRGLQYHGVGHGWTADPFGIDSSLRGSDGDNEKKISDYSRQFIAEINGERKLIHNTPNYTQFCMSNPEAQELFVNYVCDYAEKHQNIDYLHVWLGDVTNNHCECEGCQKKTPSDFYCILLNKVDKELTRRGLSNRIVFIVYTDTTFAPETEKIENPDRFSLMLAPISRSYTKSLTNDGKKYEIRPYTRNKNIYPANLAENLVYFDDWKKAYEGSSFAFEYHFWRHQYYDFSGLKIAKVICDDVKAYLSRGVNGIIQDGSQRSFFPTPLAFYAYARTMYDASLSFEEIVEECFSMIYGEDWKKFYDHLNGYADLLGYDYLRLDPADPNEISAEERAMRLEELIKQGKELVAAHYDCPEVRIRTVSVRILELYLKYVELIAKALAVKATGDNKGYKRLIDKAARKMGPEEAKFEKYYDHALAFVTWLTSFDSIMATGELVVEADN